MLNLGTFKSFLLIVYIGINENLPITDEICWPLDFWYCGMQLYFKTILISNFEYSSQSKKITEEKIVQAKKIEKKIILAEIWQ